MPDRDVLVALVPDLHDRAADHRTLATLAARLTVVPHPEPFAVAHHCESCGSTDHGRPALNAADGTAVDGAHLSVSRAGGWVALAASRHGPLGVDIESLTAARAAAFDDVAFDATERAALRALAHSHGEAAAHRMRALAWTAKESVLKAAGTGLRTDPRGVHLDLAAPDAHPRLRENPHHLTVLPFPTPAPDLVGTIALPTGEPVRVYTFGSDLL
jgi:4'-phosphopantetheinyl transferase